MNQPDVCAWVGCSTSRGEANRTFLQENRRIALRGRSGQDERTMVVGDPLALTSSGKPLELSSIRALLAPTLESAETQTEAPTHLKEAAVALVLRELPAEPAADIELLMIRRAEHPGDPWSGHMALPGGRRDPTDSSLVHTALRETYEEVGLPLERIGTLIGCLPRLPAVARGRPVEMTIQPFIFQLTGSATPRVNHEVAEVLWVSLEQLRSGSADTFIDVPLRGPTAPLTKLPAWSIGDRIVWGLTHRMISTFLELLTHDLFTEPRYGPR